MQHEYDFSRCKCLFCSFGSSDEEPQSGAISNKPTPWMVNCPRCGPVYLTSHEYNTQMTAADSRWECPSCRIIASWNDDNYDKAQEILEKLYMEKENDECSSE